MRKTSITLALSALLILALAIPAFAYTLNADGTGFVGKGEVQTAFGWNNRQLQQNADNVDFEAVVVTETETEWTCSRDGGTQTQERERTTTTTTQALLDSTTRDRNQVTGFILEGFDGDPTVTSTTDGPALGSCPSGWTASTPTPTGPEVVSSDLYALFDGLRVLL